MTVDQSKMRSRGFVAPQAMSMSPLMLNPGSVELDPITVLNQFCRVLNCPKPALFTLLSEEPLENKSSTGEPHPDAKRVGARNIVFEVRLH